ncbi:MAG: hypothetical protein SGJ21_11190 [Alphaproteobacteria bacterium]|nr:hypothetical protein [Alphaproteobacteria bacterium]
MDAPDSSWLAISELARNWSSAFTLVAALAAGLFGLFRYLRSERMRQTEQVRELYSMFFESHRYRRVRFVLGNPASEEFAQLKLELETEGMPKALEGELIDLLNFFEFVSGLTRRGLVAKPDVDWMFANFIERIAAVDFIRDYVLKNDFEELAVICRRSMRPRTAMLARR